MIKVLCFLILVSSLGITLDEHKDNETKLHNFNNKEILKLCFNEYNKYLDLEINDFEKIRIDGCPDSNFQQFKRKYKSLQQTKKFEKDYRKTLEVIKEKEKVNKEKVNKIANRKCKMVIEKSGIMVIGAKMECSDP